MEKRTNPFPPGPSGAYFPLELNEFSDARVRKLTKDYGLSGLGMHLLTMHFLSLQPDLCVEISVAEEYLQSFRVGRQKWMFSELLHNYNLYTVQGDYFYSKKVDAIMRPLTAKRARTAQKTSQETDSPSEDQLQPLYPNSHVDRSEPNPYPSGAVGEYYPLCSNELNDLRVLDYFADSGLIGAGIYLSTQVFLSVQPNHTARIHSMSKHIKRFHSSKQKWTFDEMINDYDLYISDGKQFYSQRVDAVMEPLQLKRARVAQRHREEQAEADLPMRSTDEKATESDEKATESREKATDSGKKIDEYMETNRKKDNEYKEDKRKIDGNYLEVSQHFPDKNEAYTEVWAGSVQDQNNLNNSELQAFCMPEISPESNEENQSLYRREEQSIGEREQYLNENLNKKEIYYSKKTSSEGRGTKSFDDAIGEVVGEEGGKEGEGKEKVIGKEKGGEGKEEGGKGVVEVEGEDLKKKPESSSIPKWERCIKALRKDHEWLQNFSEQTPEPEAFFTYIDEIFHDFHDSIILYGKKMEIKSLKAAKSYFRNRYCIGSPLMNRYNNKFELMLDPHHYERVDKATGKRYTIYGDAIPAGAPTYPGPPYTYYDKWRKEWRF